MNCDVLHAIFVLFVFSFLGELSLGHIRNRIRVHTTKHMLDHQLNIKSTKRYVTMPIASTVTQLLRGPGDQSWGPEPSGTRQLNVQNTPHAT